jgi:hypothetical protein
MGCAAQQSGGVASVRERQVGVKEAGLPLDVAWQVKLVATDVLFPGIVASRDAQRDHTKILAVELLLDTVDITLLCGIFWDFVDSLKAKGREGRTPCNQEIR